MKIQCSKENLLKGIQIVNSIVTPRVTLPILSNILIKTIKNGVKLTTTDLDISISTSVLADIIEEGEITISAKKFGDIIRELPNSLVTIWVKKNNLVSIECENCFFKIMGIPKDEFPKLPEFKDKQVLFITQNILKDMLMKTSFAVSHNEVRYALNGILFVIKDNSLGLVATDGRRLALIKKEFPSLKNIKREIIVPNKTVHEIIRNLKEEGELNLILGDNQVLFEINGTTIISRLIEGEFPNYEQVIPKEIEEKVRINRESFFLALKRVSLFTSPDSQSMKIDLLKNKMIISKSTPDIGESREEVNVHYSGGDLSIGFNPNYLMDALKNISQREIDLELTNPDKPGVIRTQDNYIYILLPMQLG